MLRAILSFFLLISPSVVLAAENVVLSSKVFVERNVEKTDGRTAIVLEEPKTVLPGDKLVFILKYKNAGTAPARDFIVTNPLPRAVAFQETSDGTEIVSVDGGKNWGELNALRVRTEEGGWRTAQNGDVTHIKWEINKDISVGSEGKLIFRGIVR